MKIPEKVKISGYDHTVSRVEKAFACDGDVCHGIYNFITQEIIVANEGNAEYQNTVFLHELTHGIIRNYCDGILNEYDEERFVEQFSKGLYQVINDNPDIFKE